MNKKQWLGLGLLQWQQLDLLHVVTALLVTQLHLLMWRQSSNRHWYWWIVDDKSFNQSAWEGLQDWGKEHNLSKDKGFTYFQSTSEADYANNLQQAAGSYNLIFGVGFALHNAVEEAAKDHSDLNYVLIDDVIKESKECCERNVCW